MFGWIVLAGAAAALVAYTALAAIAAQRLVQPRRRLPLITPAAIGLAYEEIRFRARGEALRIAAWHIPAAEATHAVIIAHGIGGGRGREFTVSSLELVEHLVYSGFSVLMLDLRGHGESDAARMTYGIRERRDILGAVDWLLAGGYAPGTIGVLGASMGGVAGIGAAGEEPAIGALIIDSACADFPAMIRLHFRRSTKLPLFFLPAALLIGRLLTGENMARLRPAELLRGIDRRPTMIIHANGDRLVPVGHAQALAQAGDAELWVTTSARHLGSFGADPHAYSRRVIQFFERALVGQSASRAADDAAGDFDNLLRTGAQPSSARNPGRLEMRWYTMLDGLRLRWQVTPPAADSDENQTADDTSDTVSMSEDRVR